MKGLFLLIFVTLSVVCAGQERDYALYHKGVIDAERAVFIDNDSIKGLQIFKRTFDNYDFVFVDDCIEAFELALFFRQEEYAMQFIRKAIENGFEIKLLDNLNQGCPCNFYMKSKERVTIHKPFVAKHHRYLDSFSAACYGKYVRRIDKNLFIALLKRHATEQLYKDHAVYGVPALLEADYLRVVDDNLRFMDSLAKRKIFLGERNLGIYTDKLAKALDLPFKTIESYRDDLLRAFHFPKGTHVSIQTEADYFEIGFVYNMLFHNVKSYDVMAPYKDEAIRTGYLHPREYASLRFNNRNRKTDANEQLYLRAPYKEIADTKELNRRRAQLLLPEYEIDYKKHLFQHKNNLQLFFGFFNDSR